MRKQKTFHTENANRSITKKGYKRMKQNKTHGACLKRWAVMLTLLVSLLMLSVSAANTVSKPTVGDGSEGKPYIITSADELYWFAGLVNGTLSDESQNQSANAELGGDIYVNYDVLKDGVLNEKATDLREWKPIGLASTPYEGVFDGKGYKISGLYFNNGNTTYVGLFGSVSKGSIRNVGVTDSYIYGKYYVGAIAGWTGSIKATSIECDIYNCYTNSYIGSSSKPTGGLVGYATQTRINKCWFAGTVNAEANGVGGIVASLNTGSIVQNCYNIGILTKGTSGRTGGIVGTLNQNATIENCYNAGMVKSRNRELGGIVGTNNGGTVTNCYYLAGSVVDLNDKVIDQGIGDASNAKGVVESKTADEFASGEVAYLLNTTSTIVWKQTLGKDATPNYTGETVYGLPGFYSNTPTPKLVDGYYELETKDDLVWFAKVVNAGYKSINAKLVKSIDMKGVDWTAMASTGLYYSDTYTDGNYPDAGFSGIFDGNGCTIQNLSVTSEEGKEATYGLFGTLSGTVRNLGMENFSYTHKASDMRVGAIAGQILGGTIENCYVYGASIEPKTNVVGGIAGCNYGGTIESCLVYGSHINAGRWGSIVADNRADKEGDRVGTVRHCYADNTLFGTYTGTEEACQYMRKHFLTNGYAVYLLNQDNSTPIWRQDTNGPTFVGEKVQKGFCGNDAFYTTGSTTFYEAHRLGADHRCTQCGEYDKPDVQNDRYQLCTTSELCWLSENGNDRAIDLCADLNISFKDWTPVNLDGLAFYGNGHTIEMNFTYSNFDGETSGNSVGLFSGNYATIEKLTLKGSIQCNTTGRVGAVDGDGYGTKLNEIVSYVNITNKGTGYTGGLVGEFGQNMANGSVIDHCAVYANITSAGHVGGLAGVGWNGNQYWTIRNSVYYGTVQTTSTTGHKVGGLVGYSFTDGGARYIVIQNAYYPATEGLAGVGGCDQALGTNTSETITAEELSNGALAYKLNGGVTSGEQYWYQRLDINKDKYPTLDKSRGTVYQIDSGNCTGKIAYTNVNFTPNGEHFFANGFCVACGHYQACAGEGTEEKPYKIANAGNLYWFAAIVQDGYDELKKNRGACAILTDNITVNENVLDDNGDLTKNTDDLLTWPVIGKSNEGYRGTLDGDGHTISGLYTAGNVQYGSLVGMLNGTVKNLGIIDSYFTATKYSGKVGSIAAVLYSGTIDNCFSTATIDPTYTSGGLVGEPKQVPTLPPDYIIQNSLFAGKFVQTQTTFNTGAICGYIYYGSPDAPIDDPSSLCVVNCYYIAGDYSITYGTSAIKERLASGEITYRLNQGVTDGTQRWYQTIGEDSLPGFTGQAVYGAYPTCGATELEYTNTQPETVRPVHTWNKDGFCTTCDHYQAPAGEGTAESPYLLASAGNLYWFAAVINEGYDDVEKNCSIYGKLTSDIKVNEKVLKEDGSLVENAEELRTWEPIAQRASSAYKATLDGDGHTISGLYTRRSYDGNSFIANLQGTVKNLGIVDSCFSGGSYSGGICGGGLVGYMVSGKIDNCYSTASVKGMIYTGSLVGGMENAANCRVMNSWFAGHLLEKKAALIGYFQAGTDEEKAACVQNCYYLDDGETWSLGTKVTSLQLESGEITYLLNKGVTDGTQSWYQTLGEASLPGFTGLTVYGGYDSCASDRKQYSNEPWLNVEKPAHSYNQEGQCDGCGHNQPCEGQGTVDAPYLISNLGNLYWFAEVVNGERIDMEANPSACAKLTKDIVVNKNVLDENGNLNENTEDFKTWWGLAWNEGSFYAGTFDGAGHTISGLYGDNELEDLGGFVGNLRGHIFNLGIVDSYFDACKKAGGFAATFEYGQLLNCYSTATIGARAEEYAGGLVGVGTTSTEEATLYLTNCLFAGRMLGTNTAPLIGYNVDDCTRNCYYIKGSYTSSAYGTALEASALTSGEATYRLNVGVTDGTQDWYQTLGKDALPQFKGETVYRAGENTYSNIKKPYRYVAYEGGERILYWGHIEKPFCAIIVRFKEGRMLDPWIVPIKHEKGGLFLSDYGITDDGDYTVAKVFLVQDEATIRPLCESITITK